MSADVSGSRFMRMAGSQPFFGALNKGLQKPMQVDRGGSTKIGPNTGMTTSSPRGPATHINVRPVNDVVSSTGLAPKTNAGQPKVTPEPTKDDYLNLDTPTSEVSLSPAGGAGGFGKQAEREKFLKDYDIAQGFDTDTASAEIKAINKGLGITGAYDNADFDVDTMINNSIRSGIQMDGLDVVALDKYNKESMLYDQAQSKLHGLEIYGDKALWSKQDLPNYALPEPMEAVKDPDIEGMATRFSDRIKDAADDAKDDLG